MKMLGLGLHLGSQRANPALTVTLDAVAGVPFTAPAPDGFGWVAGDVTIRVQAATPFGTTTEVPGTITTAGVVDEVTDGTFAAAVDAAGAEAPATVQVTVIGVRARSTDSIFGYDYPATVPASFGEDLLTPAQAALTDDSLIAADISGEPAFTLSGGVLTADGTQSASFNFARHFLTGTDTIVGDHYAILANVTATTGNILPTMPQATTQTTQDHVGWHNSVHVPATVRTIDAGVSISPSVQATITDIDVLHLQPLIDRPQSIVLFAGQSNMVGNAAGYTASLHPHVPGALQIPGVDNAGRGTKNIGGVRLPMIAMEPIQHSTTNIGGGPTSAFLREMRKHVPGNRTLLAVPAAYAGAGFKDNDGWHKDGTNPVAYDAFWASANSALSRAQAWNAGSRVEALVWCGGEADMGGAWDGNGNAAAHIQRLHAFFLEVRAAFGGNLPIVILGIGGDYATADAQRTENIENIEEAHRQIATGSGNATYELPNVVYVERPVGETFADDTHFDEATNLERGRQAARAWVNLAYPNRTPLNITAGAP